MTEMTEERLVKADQLERGVTGGRMALRWLIQEWDDNDRLRAELAAVTAERDRMEEVLFRIDSSEFSVSEINALVYNALYPERQA